MPPPTLTRAAFHILLVLAERDLHGLGIAAEIEAVTEGAVELGPGTLYRSLRELAETGLIRDVDPPTEEADPRRRYYRITERGRTSVATEAAQLERIVRAARERSLLPRRA